MMYTMHYNHIIIIHISLKRWDNYSNKREKKKFGWVDAPLNSVMHVCTCMNV